MNLDLFQGSEHGVEKEVDVEWINHNSRYPVQEEGIHAVNQISFGSTSPEGLYDFTLFGSRPTKSQGRDTFE